MITQVEIEEAFSKSNRIEIILEELNDEEWFIEEVEKGVKLIQDWLSQEYYQSKQDRLALLKNIKSIKGLIEYYFAQSTQFYQNMPLVSAGAMLAHKLDHLYSKPDVIKTTVEMLAVLLPCNIYEVYRNDKQQYCISSTIELCSDTLDKLNKLMYLPPMVGKPKKLTKNNSSPLKTIKRDSLILGYKENYHEDNIGLDVLNILNQTKLAIDFDFINMVKEEPDPINMLPHYLNGGDKSFEDIGDIQPEKLDTALWELYIEQRDFTYDLLKEFDYIRMTYKVGKRGRVYAQGYHINPQGDSYHKAMISLYDKEIIELPGSKACCSQGPSDEEHTCPVLSEIYCDDTPCTCCESCTEACNQEV